MDEQKKEIRQILLGRCERLADGTLTAVPSRSRSYLRGAQGISIGWGAIHILGITHREQGCRIEANTPGGKLSEVMQTMGRGVHLQSTPEKVACLCQLPMAAPVLLTAERSGSGVKMSAYTSRSIFSALACSRTMNALQSKLGGTPEAQTEGAKDKKAKKTKKQKKVSSGKEQ